MIIIKPSRQSKPQLNQRMKKPAWMMVDPKEAVEKMWAEKRPWAAVTVLAMWSIPQESKHEFPCTISVLKDQINTGNYKYEKSFGPKDDTPMKRDRETGEKYFVGIPDSIHISEAEALKYDTKGKIAELKKEWEAKGKKMNLINPEVKQSASSLADKNKKKESNDVLHVSMKKSKTPKRNHKVKGPKFFAPTEEDFEYFKSFYGPEGTYEEFGLDKHFGDSKDDINFDTFHDACRIIQEKTKQKWDEFASIEREEVRDHFFEKYGIPLDCGTPSGSNKNNVC